MTESLPAGDGEVPLAGPVLVRNSRLGVLQAAGGEHRPLQRDAQPLAVADTSLACHAAPVMRAVCMHCGFGAWADIYLLQSRAFCAACWYDPSITSASCTVAVRLAARGHIEHHANIGIQLDLAPPLST